MSLRHYIKRVLSHVTTNDVRRPTRHPPDESHKIVIIKWKGNGVQFWANKWISQFVFLVTCHWHLSTVNSSRCAAVANIDDEGALNHICAIGFFCRQKRKLQIFVASRKGMNWNGDRFHGTQETSFQNIVDQFFTIGILNAIKKIFFAHVRIPSACGRCHWMWRNDDLIASFSIHDVPSLFSPDERAPRRMSSFELD